MNVNIERNNTYKVPNRVPNIVNIQVFALFYCIWFDLRVYLPSFNRVLLSFSCNKTEM